jgi:hypothetical protein
VAVLIGAVIGAVVGVALFSWWLRTAHARQDVNLPPLSNTIWFAQGAVSGAIVGGLVGLLIGLFS